MENDLAVQKTRIDKAASLFDAESYIGLKGVTYQNTDHVTFTDV